MMVAMIHIRPFDRRQILRHSTLPHVTYSTTSINTLIRRSGRRRRRLRVRIRPGQNMGPCLGRQRRHHRTLSLRPAVDQILADETSGPAKPTVSLPDTAALSATWVDSSGTPGRAFRHDRYGQRDYFLRQHRDFPIPVHMKSLPTKLPFCNPQRALDGDLGPMGIKTK